MKIQLNPIQEIYNNISIALDQLETSTIDICEQIKNRLFEIVGDINSYADPENEHISTNLNIVKVLSLGVFGVRKNKLGTLSYDEFNSTFRFLFIDDRNSHIDNPEHLTRLEYLKHGDNWKLKQCKVNEIDALLCMWSVLYNKVADESDLQQALQPLKEQLPYRPELWQRNKAKTAILEKDWKTFAA